MKKNILKFCFYIIFFINGICIFEFSSFCYGKSNLSINSPVLKFKNGNFKILQFTDLHWKEECRQGNDSTIALMKRLIQIEHPDFVVMTGDIVVSSAALEGWNMVTKPMIEAKVPYVITFGNHDPESDMTEKEVIDKLRTLPFNMTYNASDSIYGEGNCSIPVKSSDGKDCKWILYFFDSHSYPKIFGYYDWIRYSQIEWYRKQSDSYAKEYGKRLPSLAFFHIPLPEYRQALEVTSHVGNMKENVGCPSINSGLFSSFIEKRDVLGVFTGHDHNNDYLVDLKGEISLAYGRKTGYNAAYKEVLNRGARIINLHEDERIYNTYIDTWFNAGENNYTFEQRGEGHAYPIVEGIFISDSLITGWDNNRWLNELKALKSVGIHYIIFTPSLIVNNTKGNKCLYLGKESLKRCLSNAQKCGMKVFVGLNSGKYWATDLFKSRLYKEKKKNEFIDELVSKYKNEYGDTMYGWCYSCEINNFCSITDIEKGDLVKNINDNLKHLNEIVPDMPFMFSLYSNPKIKVTDDNYKILASFFQKIQLRCNDIFVLENEMQVNQHSENVYEKFSKMRQMVNSKSGLKFWSNIELSDQKFFTHVSLPYFVNQMSAASFYVNKLVASVSPYYNFNYNIKKRYVDGYLKYYNSGFLPNIKMPDIVSNISVKIIGKNIVLKWEIPKNRKYIVGYHIYKNGSLIADIPGNISGHKMYYVDKTVEKNSIYEISSYNIMGAESKRLKGSI